MKLIDTIVTELKVIMSNLVVKYEKEAKMYETIDNVRSSDRYISACRGVDTFHTYQFFDIDAIIRAGITDLSLAQRYSQNKFLIPDNKREDIVKQQRKYIIETYVEENNYYRMLIGLPNLEDTEFIYLEDELYLKIEADKKPIHLLDNISIIKLSKMGIIDELKNKYTDKKFKYLDFLGSNKVDLVTARTVKPFTILRMTPSTNIRLYEEFTNIYDLSREYFMSVIYNKSYGSRFDLYDNYIAMMIMFMTVQKIITNTYKYGIELDFYDESTIKLFFDSYNVPFVKNVPLEYLRLLTRNLNLLLRFKSTDKVLFDICSLMGFERINIYKYYLIKRHKLDKDGNPIFAYKEVIDEDNNIYLIEDPERMYELYFQKVNIRERNIALALSEKTNRVDYDQVVLEDPYWWSEDDEVKRQLYEREFNFVETKYLNMNIMYKLTEMLFEVIYIFRMLVDKKDQTFHIDLEFPRIFERKKVNFFVTTMFLCALICKRNKLRGEIISTPSKVLSLQGFNFKADFKTIREYIRDNSEYLDQKILKFIEDLDIVTVSDVNRLYSNIRDLNDFIVDKMSRTRNLKEYRAYRKIFDSLMVVEESKELYMKSDGTIATTFLDYLSDIDPDLVTVVETTDEDKVPELIDHVLSRLNAKVTELKYLYILNDSKNTILDSILSLIKFFKSYTVDISSFGIIYLMNSRHFNMIKIITDLKYISVELDCKELDLLVNYKDNILIQSNMVQKELINIIEKYNMVISRLLKDNLSFEDKYKFLISSVPLIDKEYLYDVLKSLETVSISKEKIVLNDTLKDFIISVFLSEEIKFVDKINTIITKMKMIDKYFLYDIISSNNDINFKECILNEHKLRISDMKYILTDKDIIDSKLEKVLVDLKSNDKLLLYDVNLIMKNGLNLKENILNKDMINMTEKFSLVENINLDNKIKTLVTNLKARYNFSYYDIIKLGNNMNLLDKIITKSLLSSNNNFYLEENDIVVEYLELVNKIISFTDKDLTLFFKDIISNQLTSINYNDKSLMLNDKIKVIYET